ncbi:hypothetical protein G6011_09566 [Alternaria panax]|uniref:Uncharacterized protein n=1 Tax=Alternaria panax TaxID=48097 RepID=A0AAD4FAP2_9PLEO|nr:hypothetical protein G6011_09566 [Alternaria panax]
MSFHGTGLENLLESYTPSDVIRNPSLLLSFRQFFQRGTRLECRELLPEGFGPPSEFTCVEDPLVQRQASIGGATPQSLSPPHACFSQEITEPHSVAHKHSTSTAKLQGSPNSLQLYFETLSISGNRKNRLYRVAQRIAKTETHGEHYEFRPFEPSGKKDSFTTAKEMYQILVGSSNITVALPIRVYHVYFADAVDRYEMSLSDSSVGRSMKSLALDKLAKDLKVTRPNVASMYKMGCKYLTCMETGGPGSLLSIDGAKSDIEKFNREDFEILFKYRKHVHPDLEERSRSLDFEIVHNLVCGLRVQGVDDADIVGDRTRLIRMIRQHVDTRAFLHHGKIVSKKHYGDGNYSNIGNNNSSHSSPSQSPQAQEYTDADGQMDTLSSLRSGVHRVGRHKLVENSPASVSVPTTDLQVVDQIYANHSITDLPTNNRRQHSKLLSVSTAGASTLGLRSKEGWDQRNTVEAHGYDKITENPTKRRRLANNRLSLGASKAAITPTSMPLPQDCPQESMGLNNYDCSTDIEEWLQEFGNIDPSDGMEYVVELLGQW